MHCYAIQFRELFWIFTFCIGSFKKLDVFRIEWLIILSSFCNKIHAAYFHLHFFIVSCSAALTRAVPAILVKHYALDTESLSNRFFSSLLVFAVIDLKPFIWAPRYGWISLLITSDRSSIIFRIFSDVVLLFAWYAAAAIVGHYCFLVIRFKHLKTNIELA